MAIKTGKSNAQQNGIRGVKFCVADLHEAIAGSFDIITANLYSELLRELLPKFRGSLVIQKASG